MIEQKKMEEIKNLIKSGFDLELISFELDIPIQQLEQYKRQLELNSKKDITDRRNAESHLNIKKIRKRYNELFYKTNNDKTGMPKELSEKEEELINSVIEKVEAIIKGMEKASKDEKRKFAKSILSKIEKIEEYQLTIEQAEKLNLLLNSEELQGLRLDEIDRIEANISKVKAKIATKLAKAIDIKQYQVEDIDELKSLAGKLSLEMAKENPISVSSVKSKIATKISNIKHKQVIDRIRNNIPIEIEEIIIDLVNGKIDMQRANTIIAEEAKKRVGSRKENNFTLTEEKEKMQISNQIRTAIIEKPDKYPIINPEAMVLQLQELFGESIEQAVRTVVKNLIGRKEFETAKSICDKFSGKDRESQTAKYMRCLRNEIRNSEISDMVLQGINMNGTPEEESRYFELIQEGLKRGNVKLDAVSLGKSQDDLRNITLKDIWEDEDKKVNSK